MSICGFRLATEGILPTESHLGELCGVRSYCKIFKGGRQAY